MSKNDNQIQLEDAENTTITYNYNEDKFLVNYKGDEEIIYTKTPSWLVTESGAAASTGGTKFKY